MGVKSTHWGHEVIPRFSNGSWKKCRCAVTDVLIPKPCWKMRFGKQNTSVLLSIFNKVSSRKPTQLSPPDLLQQTAFQDSTLHVFARLQHSISVTFTCAILTQHFHKAKTLKASHLPAVDEKGHQLGKASLQTTTSDRIRWESVLHKPLHKR